MAWLEKTRLLYVTAVAGQAIAGAAIAGHGIGFDWSSTLSSTGKWEKASGLSGYAWEESEGLED